VTKEYVKKTGQRRQDERQLTIRADHREPPDIQRLTELLIRLTLQETGQSRSNQRASQAPSTYRSEP